MAQDDRLNGLLRPGLIGSVHTSNRIVKSAVLGPCFFEKTVLKESALDYFEAIVCAGAGLVIVESPDFGADEPEGMSPEPGESVCEMAPLAQTIHRHDCPAFLQLHNYGPVRPMAYSAAAFQGAEHARSGARGTSPKPLSLPEIEHIIDGYVTAAVRAREAGFDGVQIDAARSLLLDPFLARYWQKRAHKAAAASLEDRARLLAEVIWDIRAHAGERFPIVVLIDGMESNRLEAGKTDRRYTADESRYLASILDEAGADALQVGGYAGGDHWGGALPESVFSPQVCPHVGRTSPDSVGQLRARDLASLAAVIKQEVPIPVLAAGGLNPKLGEKMLRQGKADFIVFTERLLADPSLPMKTASHPTAEITPCLGCFGCFTEEEYLDCPINAPNRTECGRTIGQAEKKKRVVVVGGGPGGLEAARVAALRGHDVTLYERRKNLGGSMSMAAVVSGARLEDLPSFIRYFHRQLLELGVTVELGQEATSGSIVAQKPDAVILALGAKSVMPDIPGVLGKNVRTLGQLESTLDSLQRFLRLSTLMRLTRLWMPMGKRVVIVGGSMSGWQLGQYLAERGRTVSIIDTQGESDNDLAKREKAWLLPRLEVHGVRVATEVQLEAITDRGVLVATKEGGEELIPADSVILALVPQPETDLFEELSEHVPVVHAIGGCRKRGFTANAAGEGSAIARQI